MPLAIQGRFFEVDGERQFLRAVTYGPFPEKGELEPEREFSRIAKAGFNAIRTYQAPDRRLLDCASSHGLHVMATVPWHWDSLFTRDEETLAKARAALEAFLRAYGEHPALGALLIANEIRPDLVRFMGPVATREKLEELVAFCRPLAPRLPIAYASFPTTEYLELGNTDFTAFNVYLEQQEDFARYLRRLQNIGGDRPVMLTEFGFNTHPRETGRSAEALEEEQAKTLRWALETSHTEALAGFTVYSWSDRWKTGGEEVTDWSFGLTRRDRSDKPALSTLADYRTPQPSSWQGLITIAVCTRNGGERLRHNLPSFELLADEDFELLIIDDGSTDQTKEVVSAFAAHTTLDLRYSHQPPGGLSVARNHAARLARGKIIAYIDDDARPDADWLHYLRRAFARNPKAAAAGGPNLPPAPISRENAVVTACRGNVSHVLLSDTTAEHLPGCNLAVKVDVLLAEGGFDERFHAAGDDVDICWRLLDAGYELAFHPGASVFHDRRETIAKFVRQQRGYGEAEALLYQKHPQRFSTDGIRWEGVIYPGSPLLVEPGTAIYHGPLGEADYQMASRSCMPRRRLAPGFDSWINRKLVALSEWWAFRARRATRKRFGGPVGQTSSQAQSLSQPVATFERHLEQVPSSARGRVIERLLQEGWRAGEATDAFDLARDENRLLLAQTLFEYGLATLHLRLSSSKQLTANEAEEVFEAVLRDI
ncbi:MAG: glycosyltransferase [Verrucomicrobiota bacterium JB023]|nr:glycosyltransferase [Verrucomicrobiota bacterium JB023]